MLLTKEKLDELVNDNYNDWIELVRSMIDNKDYNEILNDVIESLYDRVIKSPIEVDNIRGYIYRACYTARFSMTSKYNRKRDNHIILEDIDKHYDIIDDEDEECVNYDIMGKLKKCEKFSWWERELFTRRILEEKTLKEMSAELSMSMSQLAYRTEKVKNWLKNNIKK